jgi:hypothetical protein
MPLNLMDIDRAVSDNRSRELQQKINLRNMLKMDKQDAEEQGMQDAFKGAYGEDGKVDPNRLTELMRGVNPMKAYEFQQSIETQNAAKAKQAQDAQVSDLDYKVKLGKYARDTVASATPENWQSIKQQLVQQGVKSAESLPDEYDPNAHRAYIMQADDWLKQNTPKEIDYNKAFLPDGSPNQAYQDYEKSKVEDRQDTRAPVAVIDPKTGKSVFVRPSDSYGMTPAKDAATTLDQEDMVDYGLPKPQVPWANTTDSKARDRFKQKEYEIARKKLDKFGEEVDKNKNLATRADRFLQLNDKVGTGGLADKIPGGQFVQSLGDDYAEMQAISADLVPEMREPGSGSTSDFDARMFQKATVGVDKPGGANKNIVTAIKAKAQLVSDRQDFLNAYLEQNGTLAGADSAWKKYANANPIFDMNSKEFKLNAKRKNWNEYFSSKQASAKPPAVGKYVETRVLPDGRKVGKTKDGKIEIIP